MMLKELREHSSLLQKHSSCRASLCPWEGLTDPSHTKGSHCDATWPVWGQGEGCCCSWGMARSFVLGSLAGIALHQCAWTGVGSGSGFPYMLTLQITVGKVRKHM